MVASAQNTFYSEHVRKIQLRLQSQILATNSISFGRGRHVDTVQNVNVLASSYADIFSIGVMMYEMLAGHHPYPARTRQEYIQLVNQEIDQLDNVSQQCMDILSELMFAQIETRRSCEQLLCDPYFYPAQQRANQYTQVIMSTLAAQIVPCSLQGLQQPQVNISAYPIQQPMFPSPIQQPMFPSPIVVQQQIGQYPVQPPNPIQNLITPTPPDQSNSINPSLTFSQNPNNPNLKSGFVMPGQQIQLQPKGGGVQELQVSPQELEKASKNILDKVRMNQIPSTQDLFIAMASTTKETREKLIQLGLFKHILDLIEHIEPDPRIPTPQAERYMMVLEEAISLGADAVHKILEAGLLVSLKVSFLFLPLHLDKLHQHHARLITLMTGAGNQSDIDKLVNSGMIKILTQLLDAPDDILQEDVVSALRNICEAGHDKVERGGQRLSQTHPYFQQFQEAGTIEKMYNIHKRNDTRQPVPAPYLELSKFLLDQLEEGIEVGDMSVMVAGLALFSQCIENYQYMEMERVANIGIQCAIRGQHTRLVSNSLYLLQLMMLNAPSEIKDLVANSFEEDMLEASAKNANTDFTSSIPRFSQRLLDMIRKHKNMKRSFYK
ncbi:MAG: hypothetical protein EZS28_020085 [Streblomastix strix]|uniref:Protein kinase domain-containing protein n=1 Tax=Streblomastix strix TaxID=222440 RepID=A0A5J4VP32_9EUKA|nr:MAG: hypothetical protein EZS28_020085 [Streblomastix strix]